MKRMYPGQPPVNYIAVDDVDNYVRKAEQLGAKVLMGKQPVPGMGCRVPCSTHLVPCSLLFPFSLSLYIQAKP
jgi:predicted enzyme related to lactoylglutathione lyase